MDIKFKDTPIIPALIAAAVAIGVSWYSGVQNRKLEKEQFESNLILKAVETGNIDSSKRNLKFLIEAGLISKNNEKIERVLIDSVLEIKFPKAEEDIINPENNYTLNEKDFLAGQILNENGKYIDSVFVRILKKRLLIDTSSFSFTYSDKNGLFKLPIPEEDNKIKVSFTKNGYRQKTIIYSKNAIKNVINIHLEHF